MPIFEMIFSSPDLVIFSLIAPITCGILDYTFFNIIYYFPIKKWTYFKQQLNDNQKFPDRLSRNSRYLIQLIFDNTD